MNKNFKVIVMILLVLGQLVIYRYVYHLGSKSRINITLDLFYLILVYISVKSGFFKSMVTATVIGLLTDYFSGGILGVFGFSRTVSAFLLNEMSTRIDLKSNFFVFLLISVSLMLSNLIASLFFYFIPSQHQYLQINMLLIQPIFTGLIGILIVSSSKTKKYLDVY